MTYLVATIRGLVFGGVKTAEADPVHHFFINTSSGERKKVYKRALRKAQVDQEHVVKEAKKKIRT